MAIILAMTYSKKLGLPNYSSHSCSVSLTVEIPDVSVAAQESTKLYGLLQTAVDNEIQQVGFMPDATTYGMNPPSNGAGNGENNGRSGHSHQNGSRNGDGDWACSEKQRQLIEKIVRENHLDKHEVENLAVEMFGVGVKQLDRLQASGLIDELLERNGGRRGNGGLTGARLRPSNAEKGPADECGI